MPLIIENGVVGYGGGSSCKKRRFSESMEDSQQQNQHQQQVRSGKVSKPRLVGIGCTGGAEFSVPAKLAVFPLSTAVPTTLKPTAASCTDLPMDAERSSPGICDAMGHDNLYVSTIVGNAISSSYSSSSNSAPSNLRHRSNSPITESTSFDQVLSRLTNRPSGSNNILSSRLRNSIENLSGSSSSDVLCASPTKLEETGSNNGFADVKGGLVLGGVSATSMDIQPQQQQQTTSAGSATRSSNRTQRRLTTATIVSRCSSLESLHRPSAAAVPPRPRPSYHHHLNMDVSSAAALKHASSRSGNKYLDYNAYKMAAPVPAMRSARPAHIQLPGEAGNNVTRSLTDMQVEAELIERKVRSTWDEAEFYAMRDGIREFGRSFPIVGEVALFDQSQEVIRHLVETELEAEYEQEKLDKEEKEGGKQQTGSSLTSTVSSSQQLQKSTAALPKDLWRHSGIKATPDLITFYYMHKHELKWKVKPKARPAQKKRKEKVRQMLRIVHV